MILALLAACTGGGPGPVDTGVPTVEDTADTSAPIDTADTAPPEEPVVIELGSGVVGHQALAPGDAVTLIHGPQGGWHVDVSAAVTGTGPEIEVHAELIITATGERIAGDNDEVRVIPYMTYDADARRGEFWALRAFVDDHEPEVDLAWICTLADEPMELRLEVTDVVDRRTGVASVGVVAALDPNGGEQSDLARCAEPQR